MSANLSIYGESAGSVGEALVTGATYTVLAGQQVKVTKLQGEMTGPGYLYFNLAAAHIFAFWFWASGQQSEDFFTWRFPATSVLTITVAQAGGVQPTRCSATGVIEMLPQP